MAIGILDYGIGNITSIANMLKRTKANVIITSDISEISDCEKLILPGVGNFDYCMQQLKKSRFFDLLNELVLIKKIPVLGVCVGCQMLMEKSEEGIEKGLGWIKGDVVKFNKQRLPANFKIPHMDWTDVNPKPGSALYWAIEEPRFYFVHSYHLRCDDESMVTATANYGYEFPASVANGNIMGVQFHPEKSHKFGMKVYENFSKSKMLG